MLIWLMQTLNINLPNGESLPEKDVLTVIATRLYDTGTLNLEQAAGMAGYSMAAFIEELTAQSIRESSVHIAHH